MLQLSFHSFPDVAKDRGKTWLAKICHVSRPNFVINKSTKVCSLLFTTKDYISGNALYSARRVKPTAVPSVFPWMKQYHSTTALSQLAASPYQRFDQFDDKVQQPPDKHDLTEDNPAENTNNDQFIMEVESGCDDITKLQKEVEELCAQLIITEVALGKSLF